MAVPESAVGMSVAFKPNIDAYFERIGFAGSIAPTLETLALLQAQHPAAIAYENLDPLMGAPVRLDLPNLQQKLVFDKRGGYCFEQNTLFRTILEDLDFEVKTYAARVLWGADPDVEQPLRHMVLIVDVAGVSYLCDVGFAAQTPTAPLRFRRDTEQETPHNTYRLIEADDTWTLEMRIDEDWHALYAFELIERSDDFLAELSDKAESSNFFSDNLFAARSEKGRRLLLWNTELQTLTPGAPTETRQLTSLAELRDTLSGPLGITLPADERLDAALQKIIDGGAA